MKIETVCLAFLVLGTSTILAAEREEGWCLQALADASNAFVQAEASCASDSPDLIDPMLDYAAACGRAREYGRAVELYDRAVTLHKTAFLNLGGEDFRPSLRKRMQMLTACGDIVFCMGNYEQSEKIYESANGVAMLGVPADSEEVRAARTGLALAVTRRWPRANVPALHQQLLASCKKVFGEEHVQVARVLSAMVKHHADLGETDVALPIAELLVGLQRKILEPDDPDRADGLNQLATLYFAKGRVKDAIPLLEDALKVRRQAFGANHALTLRSSENLAKAREALATASE
jgi:tetratricopeptide (TPR) repeat protein